MLDLNKALCIPLLTLALTLPARAEPELDTVPQVDLQRYLGTWFQIASMPAWFQRKCIADTTASYTRAAEGIGVLNRCRTGKGFDEARGLARIVDAPRNSKLEVSFFSVLGWRPVWGDYWVLALADDYSWVIVGEPKRRYGWILAREPTLAPAIQQQLEAQMAALGYDTTQLEHQPHTPVAD